MAKFRVIADFVDDCCSISQSVVAEFDTHEEALEYLGGKYSVKIPLLGDQFMLYTLDAPEPDFSKLYTVLAPLEVKGE